MSTYVISDIHGCYDEFIALLKKIQLKSEDVLVCAGDYIDRGSKNYEMLTWLMSAPSNAVLLRGNHEEEYIANVDIMKSICTKCGLNEESIDDTKILYQAACEMAKKKAKNFFDYYGTIGKLINEDLVTLKKLYQWTERIKEMPYFVKMTVKDRNCIIVHAGYIEDLQDMDTEDTYDSSEEFYLYARDDAYMCGGIKNGMVIAGHTPTILEEEFPYNDGNVYRMYDEELDCIFFDIDCGCFMNKKCSNAKLACIRLEDEMIFYQNPQERFDDMF